MTGETDVGPLFQAQDEPQPAGQCEEAPAPPDHAQDLIECGGSAESLAVSTHHPQGAIKILGLQVWAGDSGPTGRGETEDVTAPSLDPTCPTGAEGACAVINQLRPGV